MYILDHGKVEVSIIIKIRFTDFYMIRISVA